MCIPCFRKCSFFELMFSAETRFSHYDSLPDTSKTNPVDKQIPPSALQSEPPRRMVMRKNNLLIQTETKQFNETFELGRKLGKGHFGEVFLCIEKATGKEFACKVTAKRRLTTNAHLMALTNEIEIMHHLAGNPNVALIQDAYRDPEAIYIVMELCRGGELFDRIKNCGRCSEPEAAKLIRSIVTIVQSLHSSGVMHRDLKPDNFLFFNEDQNSPVKLIDFGLSTFFKPGEKFIDLVGTPYFIAPEVLKKNYGPEADIWSVGVILYILLSGTVPFKAKDMNVIFARILHGDLDLSSDPWNDVSEIGKDLVRRMLDRNPVTRITTSEILSHLWFRINGYSP